MVFRYDRSPYCHSPDPAKKFDDQLAVCGFVPPPGIGGRSELSRSPTGSSPTFWALRFRDRDANRHQAAAALRRRHSHLHDGRRAFKIYIEPAIAFAAEGSAGNPTYAANNPEYKTDLVFHAGRARSTISKLVGIYLNAGIDVGVLRPINATILGNIGAQLRLP
jgi:hypothetical protein